MTEDVNGNAKAIDETLLLVKGIQGDKEYVKRLSNAISKVYFKHSSVKLRCVGAASLNNGIKAFIIAKGEAQKNGDNLLISPSFTTVNFNGEEKTGILMEVLLQNE